MVRGLFSEYNDGIYVDGGHIDGLSMAGGHPEP